MNFMEKYPSQEQVEGFKKSCQQTIESYNEAADARMRNYYNCVDDYSWGGVCDKAQDQGRLKIQIALDVLKNQDGPKTEKFESAVLFDQSGNQVSDQIINGKFGRAWIIKVGHGAAFVGEAKKQSTYIKKGYVVKKRVIECEYYWMIKAGELKPVARVISDQIEEAADPYGLDSKLDVVAWYALNYKYDF